MRLYIAAAKCLARLIAPTGARYILDPCGFRRALLASVAACLIAFTPLIVPAQMTPQERRQVERLDARVQRLETGQIKMEEQLKSLALNSEKLDAVSSKLNTLIAARTEGEKYIGALPSIVSTAAVLLAALFYVIDLRKRRNGVH